MYKLTGKSMAVAMTISIQQPKKAPKECLGANDIA